MQHFTNSDRVPLQRTCRANEGFVAHANAHAVKTACATQVSAVPSHPEHVLHVSSNNAAVHAVAPWSKHQLTLIEQLWGDTEDLKKMSVIWLFTPSQPVRLYQADPSEDHNREPVWPSGKAVGW